MTAARPVWRQAPALPLPPVETEGAASRFDTLDAASFLALLAQFLTRGVGRQIKAGHVSIAGSASHVSIAGSASQLSTAGGMGAGVWWQVAQLAPAGSAPLQLLVEPGVMSALAQGLFGGRVSMAADDDLGALPPGNASWAVTAGLIADAVRQALTASGVPLPAGAGDVTLTTRAATTDPAPGAALMFELAVEEVTGRLLLVDENSPTVVAPAEEPKRDAAQWRQQVQSRTMAIDLPVSLRLEDIHMSLTEASALQPGDILAIARPRTFALMVCGKRLGSIAASRIAGQADHQRDQGREPSREQSGGDHPAAPWPFGPAADEGQTP